MSMSEEAEPAKALGSSEATVLIGILLFGLYTAIALPLGSLYLPYVIMLAVTGYLVALRSWLLTGVDLLLLISVLLVLCLNSILSAAGIDFIVDKYKALIQIMSGLTLGVFMTHLTPCLPKGRMAKMLIGVSVLILALAGLERAGVTRELSDSFREVAYQGIYTNAYDNNDRDLEMAGFVRPKVFTSEPAFVANFLFLSLSGFALMTPRLWSAILALGMALIGFYLIASPIMLACALSVLIITTFRFSSRFPALVLGALVGFIVLLNAPLPDPISNGFERVGKRFEPILKGDFQHVSEGSLRSRLYVPFWVATPTAFDLNPIFGVGIGGKEYLSRIIRPGFTAGEDEVGRYEQTLGTNALGNMLTTLGVAGFLTISFLLLAYLHHRYPRISYLFLVPTFILMFCRGAYETQAFWMSIFLLMSIDQRFNARVEPAALTAPVGVSSKLISHS